MSKDIFKCNNLIKRYGKFKALDGINLNLESGHIYGLVGNNGAGKTTLMRLMMGLTFPSAGKMELFGESLPSKIISSRRRIGVMIETPIYNGNMTGRRNLEVLCTLYGIKNPKTVDEALARMRLSEKGDVLVKHYSLGMRQRLGLAAALLGEPEFLILDEPVNGLDPSGIREIREILLDIYKERKITILISSHYLEQLNLLATDYIILNKGKIIQQFSKEELSQKCQSYISLEVEELEKAIIILQNKYPGINLEITKDNKIYIYDFSESIQGLQGKLAIERIEIKKLIIVGTTFEEYFTKLIGGEESV
ncbi:MAG: ABC transporter ATP-binding protein [Turicibacter sp.]